MLSITQGPNRLFTEYFWQLAPALMDKFGFAALAPFYIDVSRMFFKLKHNCTLCSEEGLGEHSSNSAEFWGLSVRSMLSCNLEKGTELEIWGGDKMAKLVAFFLPVIGLHIASIPIILGLSQKPRSYQSHLLPPSPSPLITNLLPSPGDLYIWNPSPSLCH